MEGTVATLADTNGTALAALQAERAACARRLEQLDQALTILGGPVNTAVQALISADTGGVRNPRACSLVAERVLKEARQPLTASEIRVRLRSLGRNVRYQTLYNAMVKKPRTFARRQGKWTLQAWGPSLA